ncbi:hypothetical protein KGA66_18380 [Actinocrinis puniceicyclus]|uniref:DUF7455 domain-containing protein n=1 Tax=Actinocrinis puniceicyclus TaxID=977794 RepID=A0A8J7WQT6_9ACTN|nr:hypothetical protein [Actinocrinis puniceicyclus]MBS2965030.1 hypothetical protein [Actinocrinis puniceicyclus]
MNGTYGAETIERAPAWREFEPLTTTDSACCCCAAPVVMAILPLTEPGGDPADLLLCGHHLRASRVALRAAGAVVFDASGDVVRLTS